MGHNNSHDALYEQTQSIFEYLSAAYFPQGNHTLLEKSRLAALETKRGLQQHYLKHVKSHPHHGD